MGTWVGIGGPAGARRSSPRGTLASGRGSDIVPIRPAGVHGEKTGCARSHGRRGRRRRGGQSGPGAGPVRGTLRRAGARGASWHIESSPRRLSRSHPCPRPHLLPDVLEGSAAPGSSISTCPPGAGVVPAPVASRPATRPASPPDPPPPRRPVPRPRHPPGAAPRVPAPLPPVLPGPRRGVSRGPGAPRRAPLPRLGPGQPRAPPGRGARRAGPGSGDEGPRGPHRPGAQPPHGHPGAGARGPVPRPAVDASAGGAGRTAARGAGAGGRANDIDPFSSGRGFDGWRRRPGAAGGDGPRRGPPEIPIARPHTWLLSIGWRRHGLLEPA